MTQAQSVSVGVGETWSTFASERNSSSAMAIDPMTKGNASKSKSIPSTSMPTTSLPPVRPVSAPLGAGIDPTSTARSPSKLAHILLPRFGLESEEEGSEGDELPTFYRGSSKLGMKRNTIVRPAARPFPMQLTSESPVSPCTSRFREKDGARRDDVHDDDDTAEILDVFSTPRGPSPPRSPTPSPSPVKSIPDQFVQSRQSNGFPTSPTKPMSQTDTEQHKTKQRRHPSSDWDTPVSGNEKNDILKSPRKSATHSSPRHVPRARGRASSPTPLASSSSPASHLHDVALWGSDAEGRNMSDSRRPQLEDSGSMRIGGSAGWKPRPSDASAIYISSGSEDEDTIRLGVDDGRGIGTAEANKDQDADVDTWADTGMILSAPPSPTSGDRFPPVPAVDAVPLNPVRGSKFKPAPAAVSKVDNVRVPSADFQAAAKTLSIKSTTNGEDIVVPRPVRCVPLLVARAKRSKGRNEIIDLTSD